MAEQEWPEKIWLAQHGPDELGSGWLTAHDLGRARYADIPTKHYVPAERVALLEEALREDREKWSFQTLLAVGDALLAEVYPETIFPRSDCIDAEPGPALVRAVRACREAMDQKEEEVQDG